MKEISIAKVYAKSLMQLSEELGVDLAKDFTAFSAVINQSNDLENVLFMDIFSPEEKMNVMIDLFKKIDLTQSFKNFMFFLIQEKRMGLFPIIFKETVVIDDHNRGFLKGQVEGQTITVDPGHMDIIKKYLKKLLSKEIELTYAQNEKISAGLRVKVEDLLLDATIDNQLQNFRSFALSE